MILMSFFGQSAMAQTTDEEQKFDEAIEQFGYVSGSAFQCAASDQAKAVETDALKAFTGITRLFGSDRAFFYAAAYGVGATANIDQSKCSEYIRQFQESMEKNAKRGNHFLEKLDERLIFQIITDKTFQLLETA